MSPDERDELAFAATLGLDHVADRLLRADPAERAVWRAVLVRALELTARRDERIAGLIAQAVWGKG